MRKERAELGDLKFKQSVELTLKVIGGKWKPVILCHLTDGTMRFGELKREMPSITQKMLTQQLRELEQDGIIHRQIYHQVPPKVEYSLTEYGITVKELLDVMSAWGERHRERFPSDEAEHAPSEGG
ncbi:winged helix-turn-helix transcriptional regulator [Paenibacillus mucilaginosus]|uniref:YtcD3 n=2 Tax=Paenibacillus mucilaginosus TaxID=61624 RepID=H6NGR8_9BACL|nr:YtcD3 [Paenibacillus mucilaginosus 3016]AFH66300.1 HxlR family transcriptional regulator [Paenibacillus mucilaginosus K02]MCG7213516.1 winged helix-turn-helix transcriptional regulator [Paenibacillus mucilaginosus]WDM27668.1 winged helix-turn-helix transcriptional regulator [Paenibacillus mucilaginosus]WFA22341.1 HxlR family transcriptional regulator [Paenibacillus mucilaginosus]